MVKNIAIWLNLNLALSIRDLDPAFQFIDVRIYTFLCFSQNESVNVCKKKEKIKKILGAAKANEEGEKSPR